MRANLLPSDLANTLTDPSVWMAIVVGIIFAAVCLTVGVGITRTVGLLQREAPVGETFGIGLSAGLMVIAAWWAAILSGGRSSFTPVAFGFLVAVIIGLASIGWVLIHNN